MDTATGRSDTATKLLGWGAYDIVFRFRYQITRSHIRKSTSTSPRYSTLHTATILIVTEGLSTSPTFICWSQRAWSCSIRTPCRQRLPTLCLSTLYTTQAGQSSDLWTLGGYPILRLVSRLDPKSTTISVARMAQEMVSITTRKEDDQSTRDTHDGRLHSRETSPSTGCGAHPNEYTWRGAEHHIRPDSAFYSPPLFGLQSAYSPSSSTLFQRKLFPDR